MDIAGYFIQRRVTSWLVTLVLGIGGLLAFLGIGRLEDPSFTLKNAMVITSYPGASPQQVEEEVSYPLENAIQQLPSIKKVTSISSAGLSQISLELHSQYKAEQIPQIWDELRRKINDLQPNLPPGSTRRRCGMISAMYSASSCCSPARATAPRNCAISPTTCAVNWCCCLA